MNEYDEAQQFAAELEEVLRTAGCTEPAEDRPVTSANRQLFDVACLLAKTDFSVDAKRRKTTQNTPMLAAAVGSQNLLLRRLGFAVATMGVVFVLVMVIPPLRTLAQDLWRYFQRAEDDTMALEQVDFVYEQFTRHGYFLEQAQAETGFDIKEPPAQLFQLEGVSYAPIQGEAVSLTYKARYDNAISQSHYQGIYTLWLTQIYIGDEQVQLTSMDAIGPATEVETVYIGEIPAEYVFGQWTTRDPEEGTLTWTVDNYHQLRWLEDGIYYKLIAGTFLDDTPGITPDQIRDTMIALATSLE